VRERSQQLPPHQRRLYPEALSPNTQITPANVVKLRVAWIFQTDVRNPWRRRRSS